VAQDEQQKEPTNTWSRNASLLIAEASSNEAAASLQALRRLFGPWERQLLDAPGRQAQRHPLATLICLRELLTRFYRVRHEFDQASPPPEVLPIKTSDSPDFGSLGDHDGDYAAKLIGQLPARWIQSASQKFVVQQRHCNELQALFERYFDVGQIRDAVQVQSSTLRSIEANLGYDTAVKAFCNDALRKKLAPLAAKKTLNSDAFRSMLGQQRKNYDNLTIDGGEHSFSVEGCSFRHTHFRDITLELEGCALHHATFSSTTLLRRINNCEFGKQAKALNIDCLRGDYSHAHFDHLNAKIIYPGCQLGHISNSQIVEFGGNVKHLDRCRVTTLRGICLKTTDSLVERAIRARFGTRIDGLRCAEMTDCQFGAPTIEGITSIGNFRGNRASDVTFVNTAFGTIHADATLFRLRGCLTKDLHGTIATLDRCRISTIHPDTLINKVIDTQIAHLTGGRIKLCGTHAEQPDQSQGTANDAAHHRTRIGSMTGGTIEHLNGLIEKLAGGSISRLGFEKELRLSTVRKYIREWKSGTIGGMEKTEFLVREKEMLRQETVMVAKAIRKRSSKPKKPPASDTPPQPNPPVAASTTSPPATRPKIADDAYKTIEIDTVSKFQG